MSSMDCLGWIGKIKNNVWFLQIFLLSKSVHTLGLYQEHLDLFFQDFALTALWKDDINLDKNSATYSGLLPGSPATRAFQLVKRAVNLLHPRKYRAETAVSPASNPRAQVDLRSRLVNKLPSLGVPLWAVSVCSHRMSDRALKVLVLSGDGSLLSKSPFPLSPNSASHPLKIGWSPGCFPQFPRASLSFMSVLPFSCLPARCLARISRGSLLSFNPIVRFPRLATSFPAICPQGTWYHTLRYPLTMQLHLFP